MHSKHRQNIIAIGIAGLLLVVITTAALTKRQSTLGVLARGMATVTEPSSNVNVPAKDSPTAPDFAPGTWINSDPLTLKKLRGRVVLVEFWTFGCYNCRNTLPYVKRWDESYRDKGLTVVGVHSPELEEERVIDNVRRETASLGIRYPVVTDNDYATWRAYDVEAWPTVFILDKEGRIRWKHVGEGRYGEAETIIKTLLAE
jgi:thiol-disulfide isomerase/thioredoxin